LGRTREKRGKLMLGDGSRLVHTLGLFLPRFPGPLVNPRMGKGESWLTGLSPWGLKGVQLVAKVL